MVAKGVAAPVGRYSVPVFVYPQSPTILLVLQRWSSWAAAAAAKPSESVRRAIVRVMWCLMEVVLLPGNPRTGAGMVNERPPLQLSAEGSPAPRGVPSSPAPGFTPSAHA